MSLKIFSKQFFSNYIFHPLSNDLSKNDKRKALISSICLGVLTLGLSFAACAIKFRHRKYTLENRDNKTAHGVDKVFKHVKKITGKNQHTIEELLNLEQLSGKEFYYLAVNSRTDRVAHKQLLTKAADKDYPIAMGVLGELLYNETNNQDEQNHALELLERAAPRAANARQTLAQIYLNREVLTEEEVDHVEELVRLSLQEGKTIPLPVNTGTLSSFTVIKNEEQLIEYMTNLRRILFQN